LITSVQKGIETLKSLDLPHFLINKLTFN